MSGSFLDSNIVLYALTGAGAKADIAQTLFEGATVSAQVLNEVANVMRRKFGISIEDVETATAYIRASVRETVAVTVSSQARVCEIVRQTGYSVFDAQIIASAIEAGCDELMTEDLQHTRQIEGLVIVNPFA